MKDRTITNFNLEPTFCVVVKRECLSKHLSRLLINVSQENIVKVDADHIFTYSRQFKASNDYRNIFDGTYKRRIACFAAK